MAGTIRNAQTNVGEPGVIIKIRGGSGIPTGVILQTVYSGSDGSWQANNLDTGNYVAECSKNSFSDVTRSGLVVMGGANVPTTANQNILITAKPQMGEMRIVLRWGPQPRDLDSHLTGPLTSAGRFHVYFASRGSSIATPFAELDRDVTTGYGPETVTIKQQLSGLYRYSVHDYTNQQNPQSMAMALSGATVVVFFADGTSRPFPVPARSPSTLWTVFEMTNGNIVPINHMSHHQNTNTIP